jgi:hypothetical protein
MRPDVGDHLAAVGVDEDPVPGPRDVAKRFEAQGLDEDRALLQARDVVGDRLEMAARVRPPADVQAGRRIRERRAGIFAACKPRGRKKPPE